MAISINGNGITSANIADGAITNADIADVAASKLTGALPAISGAALTNLPGGGKVLQVVNTVIDATSSTTSTSYAASNLSLSITPTSATSKILVMMDVSASSTRGSFTVFRLYRGVSGSYSELTGASSTQSVSAHGTGVSGFMTTWYNPVDTHQDNVAVSLSGKYLDSPSTTSAVDYKLYWRSRSGSLSYINRADSEGGDHNAHGVCTITLMEIGA